MLSGRRLDLLNPSPLDIEIEDIAHGLARVARWNGQTRGEHAFSVAQHSLLVEALIPRLAPKVPARWRLAALLHDAPEYVIGDMISPFKAVIGGDYKAVEARLAEAIHLRFGLQPKPPEKLKALVKRCDAVAAYYEATRLAGFGEEEARRFFGRPAVPPELVAPYISPASAAEIEARYLERFRALDAAQDDAAAHDGPGVTGNARC